jgi:hypothetical protein
MGDKCPKGDEALVPSIRLSQVVCFSSCRQAYSILSTSNNVYCKGVQYRNYPDCRESTKKRRYIPLLRAHITMTGGDAVPKGTGLDLSQHWDESEFATWGFRFLRRMWRWLYSGMLSWLRQWSPLKRRWISTRVHGATSHKTAIFKIRPVKVPSSTAGPSVRPLLKTAISR